MKKPSEILEAYLELRAKVPEPSITPEEHAKIINGQATLHELSWQGDFSHNKFAQGQIIIAAAMMLREIYQRELDKQNKFLTQLAAINLELNAIELSCDGGLAQRVNVVCRRLENGLEVVADVIAGRRKSTVPANQARYLFGDDRFDRASNEIIEAKRQQAMRPVSEGVSTPALDYLEKNGALGSP